MANYTLSQNEGIILQCDTVMHNRKQSELILTNQNLICVESKPGFLKTTYNETKYPLNQIKVVNGQAQVFANSKSFTDSTLQVHFINNQVEEFGFLMNSFEFFKGNSAANDWVKQINYLLTGNEINNEKESSIIGNIKNALGTVGIKTHNNKQPENVTIKCIGCMAPLSGKKGQTVRCKYCDTKQTL